MRHTLSTFLTLILLTYIRSLSWRFRPREPREPPQPPHNPSRDRSHGWHHDGQVFFRLRWLWCISPRPLWRQRRNEVYVGFERFEIGPGGLLQAGEVWCQHGRRKLLDLSFVLPAEALYEQFDPSQRQPGLICSAAMLARLIMKKPQSRFALWATRIPLLTFHVSFLCLLLFVLLSSFIIRICSSYLYRCVNNCSLCLYVYLYYFTYSVRGVWQPWSLWPSERRLCLWQRLQRRGLSGQQRRSGI